MLKEWYEVYIDMGEEGTMPVIRFSNKEAAIQYAKENKTCDGFPLQVDRWIYNKEKDIGFPTEQIYPIKNNNKAGGN